MTKKELKERASFTFDKKTIKLLEEIMQTDDYRNKSHIVESAIKKLAKEKLDKENEK